MTAVPPVIPDNTPVVLPMVATGKLLLVQVPPPGVELNGELFPVHTNNEPLMAVGRLLAVTVIVL